MTVWIAQCLCPTRHCLLGCASEGDGPEARAQAEHALRTMVTHGLALQVINPWCALCGARVADWRYEVRRSRFATLEAATPELAAFEAAEAVTAAVLKAQGRAYDSPLPPTKN